MSWDVLIKGGTIVDGSGRPAYGGDVAIEDGRIAAMGRVDGASKRTIDASGLAVAPGFLDVHTHYDAQLAWDPYCTPSCFHGVTTVLMGNCGFAMAPVANEAAKDYLVGLFAATEQVPRSVLEAGVPFAWKTYPEFLGWLRQQGLGINVMAQVGHSALRTYVMGEAALERAATPDEIELMAKLAAEGLAAGAAGVSTSQVAHQRDDHDRHIPTYFAEDPEIIALARTIRE
ncbi:MAG TPA: amidohydrolase family protein, partial [Chloroflexota bacterium]|nr:amidohydrolase family protein [Chloroflexota bacterium]